MGLEKVVEDILNNARSQAGKLESHGKKEASAMLKKATTESSLRIEENKREVDTLVKDMEKRELLRAELEARKLELDAEKELFEQVYKETKTKLALLDKKQKRKIYSNLLKKAGREIKIKHIYANEKDKELLKSLSKSTAIKKADCVGGFIAENSDGSLRVDYTFETLLGDVRAKHLKEISSLLFGKKRSD